MPRFWIGLATMAAIAFLLGWPSTEDGLYVPDELPELLEAAEEEDYTPPTRPPVTCFPESQVTDSLREEVELVTGIQPVRCTFMQNALTTDALWGILAAVIVLVLAFAGLVAYSAHSEHTWADIALAVAAIALLIGGAMIGIHLWDDIKEFLASRNVVGVVFWKGFGAVGIFGVGAAISYFLFDD